MVSLKHAKEVGNREHHTPLPPEAAKASFVHCTRNKKTKVVRIRLMWDVYVHAPTRPSLSFPIGLGGRDRGKVWESWSGLGLCKMELAWLPHGQAPSRSEPVLRPKWKRPSHHIAGFATLSAFLIENFELYPNNNSENYTLIKFLVSQATQAGWPVSESLRPGPHSARHCGSDSMISSLETCACDAACLSIPSLCSLTHCARISDELEQICWLIWRETVTSKLWLKLLWLVNLKVQVMGLRLGGSSERPLARHCQVNWTYQAVDRHGLQVGTWTAGPGLSQADSTSTLVATCQCPASGRLGYVI